MIQNKTSIQWTKTITTADAPTKHTKSNKEFKHQTEQNDNKNQHPEGKTKTTESKHTNTNNKQ